MLKLNGSIVFSAAALYVVEEIFQLKALTLI